MLLDDCLLGSAILHDESTSDVFLVYVFHDISALYYYVGGLPVRQQVAGEKLKGFPARLSEFYNDVHNGFTFFPARSMGPLSVDDFSSLSDLVDEDVEISDSLVTVFSNGGGDYLVIDRDGHDEDKGFIWWHDEPLTTLQEINIFEVMNTWISIFLEDTRLRNEFLSGVILER
ncbi:hypothetical protein [Pseudomonas eucalypticola]|uniref:SMI1/KNR4 family protein n=1 Tax=Pseudomonas eucalypticola TaxID=2599595 RepID=A0A7D5D484_9PSED|nr:hypothetical protein [Pseudomonas eucalypticola]QKZ02412.1 hypothetical protein HWQ56_00840 [Pseudomonas eucalypticola]